MSNRFDQIRKALKGYKYEEPQQLSMLSIPIAMYIDDVINQWHGIRKWTPRSDANMEVVEKSRAVGEEITSKKGEIAEKPFDIEVNEIPFAAFGIKQSITHGQLTKGNLDTAVDVVERLMSSMAAAMQVAENVAFCNHVYDRVRSENTVINVGGISPSSLNEMFRMVESEGWLLRNIIVGSNVYATIRTFGKDFFDEATTREIMTTGLFGHLWTSDIRAIPHNGFSHVLGFGEKIEKYVTKDNPEAKHPWNQTKFDEENSILRNSVEHVLPTKPMTVAYNFIPHKDAARSRHVFEAKSEIGIRINNLSGVACIQMA